MLNNPIWHKLFSGGLDMGGGSGFMNLNHLVTHQAHKNGQYYALKQS